MFRRLTSLLWGNTLIPAYKKLKREKDRCKEILTVIVSKERELLEQSHKDKKSLEYNNQTSDPEYRELEQKIESISQSLARHLIELEVPDSIDPVSTLAAFDPLELPDNIQDFYRSAYSRYKYTGNNHYVLEVFCMLVRNDITPPTWVLKSIADGFLQFLLDPNRDPKQLGKKLNLEGATSGSSNPWRQREMHNNRSEAMRDMALLISDFGLSQIRAAEAVKIKHDIALSTSTLKKYFFEYHGDIARRIISFPEVELEAPLNEYERTKFVSSFPVSARKLFKK